jgi:hypothetical protein
VGISHTGVLPNLVTGHTRNLKKSLGIVPNLVTGHTRNF